MRNPAPWLAPLVRNNECTTHATAATAESASAHGPRAGSRTTSEKRGAVGRARGLLPRLSLRLGLLSGRLGAGAQVRGLGARHMETHAGGQSGARA